MKTLTFETVLKTIKEYFLMALGMMLYSFGWIGCIMPVKGTGGGAAGLSLVLCHALEQVGIDIQIGTMVFFLNAVLLLIAGVAMGNAYPASLFDRVSFVTKKASEDGIAFALEHFSFL